ncbi:hypothetical protein AcW1_010180 [Taiwanofungus camphoratus]|nr:hypothetical protein AcW1_010180 [Antrodia cinnamomea]
MSSTLSVKESLYLMANRVRLALSHLPGPNHSRRTWFEERLEQELCPLWNLLIMASTAGERPYVPAIILSGAGEFACAAQHSVPVRLEVMSADDLEVKANPWYSKPPEGAVSEVGEESMEDTWWQAEAVAGAKRTRETSVEVEVEEETQRRKKVRMGPEVVALHKSHRTVEVPQRVEVDDVSWEEGMVEEDVEMEGMSPVEGGRRCEEKKLAWRPATASPLPHPLPRTPHKPKGILKQTTPVPSEDEQGRPLRRSSWARSQSWSVSAAPSEQEKPSRRLGAMCSDEWAQPMDPPCTRCEPGECIISTHPDRPPTGKVTACDRCHFAKAKCTQPPPTTRHCQVTAKVANATASSSRPSTGKKTRRAQAVELAGQCTLAPKTGKTAVSRRRSPSPPTDEPSGSGGEGTVASMPPK